MHCQKLSGFQILFLSWSLTLNVWFLISILDFTRMNLKTLETFILNFHRISQQKSKKEEGSTQCYLWLYQWVMEVHTSWNILTLCLYTTIFPGCLLTHSLLLLRVLISPIMPTTKSNFLPVVVLVSGWTLRIRFIPGGEAPLGEREEENFQWSLGTSIKKKKNRDLEMSDDQLALHKHFYRVMGLHTGGWGARLWAS